MTMTILACLGTLFAAIDGARDFDRTAARGAAEITLAKLADDVLSGGETPHVTLPSAILDDPAGFSPDTPAGRTLEEASRADFAKRYADETAAVLKRLAAPLDPKDVFPAAFLEKAGVLPKEKLDAAVTTFIRSVAADVERQKKHQIEIVRRARVNGHAPEVVRNNLVRHLQRRVAEDRRKAKRGTWVYDVFPSVTNAPLEAAVVRTVMGRVAEVAPEAPSGTDAAQWVAAIRGAVAEHASRAASEKILEKTFREKVNEAAVQSAAAKALETERTSFTAFATARVAEDETVAKPVRARVSGEFRKAFDAARTTVRDGQFKTAYPTLAEGTFHPEPALADEVCPRSDFKRSVRTYMPKAACAVIDETVQRMETVVTEGFERARTARSGQHLLVEKRGKELERTLKADRKKKGTLPKASEIAACLRKNVTEDWGKAPEETVNGYAALFPSVERRIEEKARALATIVEETPPPEKKPEKPPETPPPPEPPKVQKIIPLAATLGLDPDGTLVISLTAEGHTLGQWRCTGDRKKYRQEVTRMTATLTGELKKLLKRLPKETTVLDVSLTVQDGFVYCGAAETVDTCVRHVALEAGFPVMGLPGAFDWGWKPKK